MEATGKGILALLGSVVVLATVYQVLTAKNTVGVINGATAGFANILRSAQGR
jgi:hypothetical protein